jgi:hypothetical protein
MAAYIPAFTDKADAVEDKRKRMLRLIDSAKVRAGRAWTPEMDAAVKALMQPGAAAQPPASGALTPAEQAELDQLRSRFGGGR